MWRRLTMGALSVEQRDQITGVQRRDYSGCFASGAGVRRRDADGEVAEEDRPVLEGRAVPYNTWTDVGWYMERILPRTFAKSIKEAARQLPLLLFHDSRDFPAAMVERWDDGDDGLDGTWLFDAEDERAMRAYSKASRGFLTGLSVGFVPIVELRRIDDEIVDVNTEVEIDDLGQMWVTRRQARLLETSLTPTPAYVGAGITAREIASAGVSRQSVATPRLLNSRLSRARLGI